MQQHNNEHKMTDARFTWNTNGKIPQRSIVALYTDGSEIPLNT